MGPYGCSSCGPHPFDDEKPMSANDLHHMAHPANQPVPWEQSETMTSLGLAKQVRTYEQVPEVTALVISGRTG
jgi:hypothetical protein